LDFNASLEDFAGELE